MEGNIGEEQFKHGPFNLMWFDMGDRAFRGVPNAKKSGMNWQRS